LWMDRGGQADSRRAMAGITIAAATTCVSISSAFVVGAAGAITPFQGTSAGFTVTVRGSYNPNATRTLVWAPPISLAATLGISVDFSSSRY
jgi:hypothetical protein